MNQLSNYERGRKLEKRTLDYFLYHGFVGNRSAQSKGPYDVIVSPPIHFQNQSTLHIQCGPKSKKELEAYAGIAQKHHGMKAHLYKNGKKEPKISLLDFDNYTSLQEFLATHYGALMPSPWKQALDRQARFDRDAREAKKRV